MYGLIGNILEKIYVPSVANVHVILDGYKTCVKSRTRYKTVDMRVIYHMRVIYIYYNIEVDVDGSWLGIHV